jgi:o-succinylbenzoate synthase
VKIESARIEPFRLPLARPLATARGAVAARTGWILSLETDDGRSGLGEAAPFAGFATETLHEARLALESAARWLEGADPREASDWAERLGARLTKAPAALFAVDCALHDLAAQAAACSMARWLAKAAGRTPHDRLPLSVLLVEDDPTALRDEARHARAEGFAAMKLKLGAEELSRDLERVAAAREGAGADARLRADASGGWSRSQAACALTALAPYGLDYVEQPVAAHDVEGLACVRRDSPVPVAGDESLTSLESAERILDAEAADLLILKLPPLGGLQRARRVAELARARGVAVVVTSFLDAAPGLLAAVHFAASLPGPLEPCGLATSRLLARDLAVPPRIERGSIEVPRASGLGAGRPASATAP